MSFGKDDFTSRGITSLGRCNATPRASLSRHGCWVSALLWGRNVGCQIHVAYCGLHPQVLLIGPQKGSIYFTLQGIVHRNSSMPVGLVGAFLSDKAHLSIFLDGRDV